MWTVVGSDRFYVVFIYPDHGHNRLQTAHNPKRRFGFFQLGPAQFRFFSSCHNRTLKHHQCTPSCREMLLPGLELHCFKTFIYIIVCQSCLKRRVMNGERISIPSELSSSWRTCLRPSHSCLMMCWPWFQDICKETSLSLTFPLQEASLIWSALSGISFDSRDMAGSLSHQGEQSHWGYLASIFETSVVPESWEMSCKMSRLVSFPIIVLRIPKSSSRQSVPNRIIQNSPLGSLIFSLATQKRTFLIMIMRLI